MREQKITLGEMRSSGVRGDQWPDHLRLSDLESRFVCKACGQRGADARPDFDWEEKAQHASKQGAPCISLRRLRLGMRRSPE
jgi:hypothetical protein